MVPPDLLIRRSCAYNSGPMLLRTSTQQKYDNPLRSHIEPTFRDLILCEIDTNFRRDIEVPTASKVGQATAGQEPVSGEALIARGVVGPHLGLDAEAVQRLGFKRRYLNLVKGSSDFII
jgi:hypothetical protein